MISDGLATPQLMEIGAKMSQLQRCCELLIKSSWHRVNWQLIDELTNRRLVNWLISVATLRSCCDPFKDRQVELNRVGWEAPRIVFFKSWKDPWDCLELCKDFLKWSCSMILQRILLKDLQDCLEVLRVLEGFFGDPARMVLRILSRFLQDSFGIISGLIQDWFRIDLGLF